MIKQLHLVLNRKTSIIFFAIILPIIVFDLTVVKFSAYSRTELPFSVNVLIFTIFSSVVVLSSVLMLVSARKNTADARFNISLGFKFGYYFIVGTQILSSFILFMINLQMISVHNYNIMYLQVGTYLGHLASLLFISFLAYKFINWARSNRNSLIILFATGFLLICGTLIVSLIYLQIQFAIMFSHIIKHSSIHSVVVTHPIPRGLGPLNTLFDFFSFLSFLVIWAATAVLLGQYRFRMGKAKYYVLITIPLVYYTFPFEGYFGNVFAPLRLGSPVIFGIFYVLIFSATKQVGAFMFGLSFWTASSLISRIDSRKSLLVCALGMVILFSSVDIDTLQYAVYPPFGLVTEAFLPLGSYLFFTGISMSARNVARDGDLRKQFYRSAESQLNLLKTIGVVEMEKELISRYKSLQEHSSRLNLPEESAPQDEDIKEIMRDVLNELNSKVKDSIKKS